MEAYEKGAHLGEGTYGSVVAAVHRPTGRRVAIKKVRCGSARDGVHISALREIKALKEVRACGCGRVRVLVCVCR